MLVPNVVDTRPPEKRERWWRVYFVVCALSHADNEAGACVLHYYNQFDKTGWGCPSQRALCAFARKWSKIGRHANHSSAVPLYVFLLALYVVFDTALCIKRSLLLPIYRLQLDDQC